MTGSPTSLALRASQAGGRRAAVFLAGLLAAFAPLSASAAESPEPLKLVVHPAPEPYPALKYRFHPGLIESISGNAAVEYGKVTAEQRQTYFNDAIWKDLMRWLEAPLADLRREDAIVKTDFEKMFDDLDRAAACNHCDWQLPFRRQPFYAVLLSELQQTRNFARLLGVRARAEIGEGRFEEAIGRFRSGYRLAQHVDEGQTLIHSLVSAAIARILSAQLQQFIQQAGTPNLYWALATLPCPLVDTRPGVDGEHDILFLTFPELNEVETAAWPAERWQELAERVAAGLVEYRVLEGEFDAKRLLAERTPKLLPEAKHYLLDHGLSPEQVGAMSSPQIALVYTVKLYNELRDEMLKWYYLPYWQAQRPMEKVAERLEKIARQQQEILPLASQSLPPMMRARNTLVRADREIALLRAVELLRMFGAGHENRLPQQWSDVTEAPIPPDPVTGEPFAYSLRGATAIIEGPPLPDTPYVAQGPARPDIPLRVEVQFAK